MLYYCETALSNLEVPEEISICIYISGCTMHCPECHYPELQKKDYGAPLSLYLNDILDAYHSMASCLCIMGEGERSDRNELEDIACRGKERGLKTCLYSGRDTKIEPWMYRYDYVKTGSYKKKLGALDKKTTNQRMYKKTDMGYIDITSAFWNARLI